MYQDQESSIWSWVHDLPEVQHVHKRSSGRKFYANNMFIHGPAEPPTVDDFSSDIFHPILARGASDLPLTFCNIQKAFPGPVHEARDDYSTKGEMAHDDQVLLQSHYGYLGRTIIQVPEIVLSLPRENPEIDDPNHVDASCEQSQAAETLSPIIKTVADTEPTPSKPPKGRSLFEHTQPVQNITNLLLWSDGRMSVTDAIFVWNMLKQARRLERHCGDIPAAVELDFGRDEGYESDIAAQMCHKPIKGIHSDQEDRNLLHVAMLEEKKVSQNSPQKDEGPVEIEASTEECVTDGEIKNISKNYPSLGTPEDEIRRLTMTNAAWRLIEWMKCGATEDVISLNFGPSFVSPTTRRNTIDFHQRLQEELLNRTQNLFHETGNYITPSYDLFIGSAHLPDIVPNRDVRKSKSSNKVALTTPLAHRHDPTMLTDSFVPYSGASQLRLSHSLPYSPYAKTSLFDQVGQYPPFNNHSQEYSTTTCQHHEDQGTLYADCYQGSGMENVDDPSSNIGQGSWLNLSSEEDGDDGLTQRRSKSRHSSLNRKHPISTQVFQSEHSPTPSFPVLGGLGDAILQRSPGIGRSAAAAEHRVKMFAVSSAPEMNVNGPDGSQGMPDQWRVRWDKDAVLSEARALEVDSLGNQARGISDAMRSRIEVIERKQHVEPPDGFQTFLKDEKMREKTPSLPVMTPSPVKNEEKKEEHGSLPLASFSTDVREWNNHTSPAMSTTASLDVRLEKDSTLKSATSKESLDKGYSVRSPYPESGYVDRFVGKGTNPQQSVAYYLACKELTYQTALRSIQEPEDFTTKTSNGGDEAIRRKDIRDVSISSVEYDSSLSNAPLPFPTPRGYISAASSSTSLLPADDSARNKVATRGREHIKDERFMDGRSKAMEVLGCASDIAIRRALVDIEYTNVALPVSKSPAYLEDRVDGVTLSPEQTINGYGSISFLSLSTESTGTSSGAGNDRDTTTLEHANSAGMIMPSPRISMALSYKAQPLTAGYQQQAPMSFTPSPATSMAPNQTTFNNCRNIFRKCLGRSRQRPN
ncbi:hypothetical protein DFP73DRAFT_598177 [Morchella snyderi]|nr:hypothetical protein DFP73DRAFT_598177 [Morchella snyderi]